MVARLCLGKKKGGGVRMTICERPNDYNGHRNGSGKRAKRTNCMHLAQNEDHGTHSNRFKTTGSAVIRDVPLPRGRFVGTYSCQVQSDYTFISTRERERERERERDRQTDR